jgi:hypothetical protein
LLNVSLRGPLFADDVGIRELLVYGDQVVQHGCAAVDVDDVVTRIHSVVVGEGQLPVLHEMSLVIDIKDSIVVAVHAIIGYEAGVGRVVPPFTSLDACFVGIEHFLLGR